MMTRNNLFTHKSAIFKNVINGNGVFIILSININSYVRINTINSNICGTFDTFLCVLEEVLHFTYQ